LNLRFNNRRILPWFQQSGITARHWRTGIGDTEAVLRLRPISAEVV